MFSMKHHHFGFKFKTSAITFFFFLAITFPSLGTLRIMHCGHFPDISKKQIHMLMTRKSSAELILQVVIQVVFIRKTKLCMLYVQLFSTWLEAAKKSFWVMGSCKSNSPVHLDSVIANENTPTCDAFLSSFEN